MATNDLKKSMIITQTPVNVEEPGAEEIIRPKIKI